LRFLRTLARVAALGYLVALLALVWFSRRLTFSNLATDPFFAAYSIAVVAYVLGRFAVSLGYRPLPDQGDRPTVSIIVPAFNEEDGIVGTIESCFASEYPEDRFEVIVVNDGSSDGTWANILAAKERFPRLYAVDLGRNYGKRGAMAEGMRRATGEVYVFVDSDSYLARDCLRHLVAPFRDRRVGAVVGHADAKNRDTTAWARMQAVRYWSAFRVIKATESMFGGTVICASGCCAAYRAEAVLPLLDEWEFQKFLGQPATFGDDRALTNRVLRRWRVVYQENALAETVVPERLRVFLRQQLRWKKSWLRENIYVIRFIWKKHPLGALFTYAGVAFPFIAPFVVLHAVTNVVGGLGTLWFYLVGSYAMAVLYSLYYLVRRPDGLWFHGVTFVALYMSVLVFQTYWGMATMRDTRWGTRPSTVDHASIDPALITALPPSRPDEPALVHPIAAEPARAEVMAG
jgi:hyaluronan synthase